MTAVMGWSSMTDRMAVFDESIAPGVDEALPDEAGVAARLPGGADPGVGQPDPGRFQGRLLVGQLGHGDLVAGVARGEGRLRGLELGVRKDAFLVKGLGPVELLLGQPLGGLGLLQVGLGDAQVGLGLDDLLLVLFVLEKGHELAARERVPDVDVERLDPAGDLGDDGEIGLGDQVPREGADVPDAAALDGRDLDSDRGPARAAGLAAAAEPVHDLPGHEDEEERTQDGERPGLFRPQPVFQLVSSRSLTRQTSQFAGLVHHYSF